MPTKKMIPDQNGYYGDFGGQYVPETLMRALEELKSAYKAAIGDAAFKKRVNYYLKEYAGRPTPLYYAEKLSKKIGGAKIFLKREDLLHTGAHKINNTLGQVLLAKRMKKTRVIAETGAGQHGVATATACALLNLECEIYMGEADIHRQAINVSKMRLLGARVIPVVSGSNTLKDAMNEAIRDWVTNVQNTFYVIGSVAGPHPYPQMVRDFQRIIGKELKGQFAGKTGGLPNYLVACVGGGSNAMGLFYEFLKNKSVKMIGVEAAGLGLGTTKHSATLAKGSVGVLHGSKSYVLQNDDGQIRRVHSISAGLDYPGVGPEHAFLKSIKRAQYVTVTDREALEGFELLSREEGIIPALESSHAIFYATKLARKLTRTKTIVVCCSGRGDKDMSIISEYIK